MISPTKPRTKQLHVTADERMIYPIKANWRGCPLESHAVVVNLIANTTTAQGLKINAKIDTRNKNARKQAEKSEIDSENILKFDFYGEWNPLATEEPQPKNEGLL